MGTGGQKSSWETISYNCPVGGKDRPDLGREWKGEAGLSLMAGFSAWLELG